MLSFTCKTHYFTIIFCLKAENHLIEIQILNFHIILLTYIITGLDILLTTKKHHHLFKSAEFLIFH